MPNTKKKLHKVIARRPASYLRRIPSSDGASDVIKGLTETQNPSCTTTCIKLDEPLTPTATDELLAELAEGSGDALLSLLPPDLRLVVQHWSDLPDSDQRAILAIVRRLTLEVGDENVTGAKEGGL